MRRQRFGFPVAALAAVVIAGCGGPPATPEEEIRQLVAEAESAAQERDLATLREHVAEDYADRAGRDRVDLLGFLRIHFLRNERIHLLVRVQEIVVDPKGRAELRALVATAGRPIPALEALADTSADLLWVDLALARRDERWAVTRADWERARLEDLL